MVIILGEHPLAHAIRSNKRVAQLGGAACARRLHQRLMELAAAETLAVVATLPALRLQPDSDGQPRRYSISVDDAHRLVFEVATTDDVAVAVSPSLDKVNTIRLLHLQDTK